MGIQYTLTVETLKALNQQAMSEASSHPSEDERRLINDGINRMTRKLTRYIETGEVTG